MTFFIGIHILFKTIIIVFFMTIIKSHKVSNSCSDNSEKKNSIKLH